MFFFLVSQREPLRVAFFKKKKSATIIWRMGWRWTHRDAGRTGGEPVRLVQVKEEVGPSEAMA